MARPEMEDIDALVIGGGPAGLTCAIYLARYRRRVLVIDSRNSRAALIPETHNYLGFADGIAGPRLLEALTSQAKFVWRPDRPRSDNCIAAARRRLHRDRLARRSKGKASGTGNRVG
jgi:2-polyprenyl-6-methoxyphenol hydroxylase-like FAD-dependent oxidoreductase